MKLNNQNSHFDKAAREAAREEALEKAARDSPIEALNKKKLIQIELNKEAIKLGEIVARELIAEYDEIKIQEDMRFIALTLAQLNP